MIIFKGEENRALGREKATIKKGASLLSILIIIKRNVDLKYM